MMTIFRRILEEQDYAAPITASEKQFTKVGMRQNCAEDHSVQKATSFDASSHDGSNMNSHKYS